MHSPFVLITKLCTVFAIYADEAAAVMSFDLATAQVRVDPPNPEQCTKH
jgi:hypothetical protein